MLRTSGERGAPRSHPLRLGLSQEGLGDRLGVSRQAVSKWEAELSQLSQFTLSVGFVRDGVEYVCPLAEFSQFTHRHSSYTSLWP